MVKWTLLIGVGVVVALAVVVFGGNALCSYITGAFPDGASWTPIAHRVVVVAFIALQCVFGIGSIIWGFFIWAAGLTRGVGIGGY